MTYPRNVHPVPSHCDRWTEQEEQLLAELHAQRQPFRAIAAALGRSTQAAQMRARALKLPPRPKGGFAHYRNRWNGKN